MHIHDFFKEYVVYLNQSEYLYISDFHYVITKIYLGNLFVTLQLEMCPMVCCRKDFER